MDDALWQVPAACRVLVSEQTWARPLPDGRVEVGITPLGLHLAGEIYMCRIKRPGTAIEQGRSLAVVELAKSIVSVNSPVSGTVAELNEAVERDPALLAREPYGGGWVARLQGVDLDAQGTALLQGEALPAAQRAHAALFPEAFE